MDWGAVVWTTTRIKARSIDDFSEFHVNNGLGSANKITLLSLEGGCLQSESMERGSVRKELDSVG